MESKGFLLHFSNLASGEENLIRSSLVSIRETLVGAEGGVESIIGRISPDVKYTLDRLLKGLTGGKTAKIGFSMGLVMLFKDFPIKVEKIYEYFQSLDHSGISQYQILASNILLSLSLSRASKSTPPELITKLTEIFKTKNSLKESAAVALSSLPNAKNHLKHLRSQNEINSLLIHYSLSSDESILNQALRHKEIIIKGSFRALPRLHNIWKFIIPSSIRLNKQDSIFETFADKDLVIEDKNRSKRVLLSFLLFEAFMRHGSDLTKVLQCNFYNVWQDNLFTKKLRDHEKAAELKDSLLQQLEKVNRLQYLKHFIGLADSVKTLDMIKVCIEKLLDSASIEEKSWLIEEISSFNKNKKGNFAVNIYWYLAKSTPELEKACLKGLLTLATINSAVAETAKIKILNLASDNDHRKSVFEYIGSSFLSFTSVQKVLKRIKKYKTEDIQESLGKRGPGKLCIVTAAQLQKLVEVLEILGVESVLYENNQDFLEMFQIIRSIAKGLTQNLDDLCYFLLSMLAKPVGYIKASFFSVFKLFVNEVSDEFVKRICEIVKTRNFTLENSDVPEEPNTEKQSSGLEVLFGETPNTQSAEKSLKDNFVLRTSELLEIIIKKSSNMTHKLLVYETLVSALHLTSSSKDKQHFLIKFSSILQKIHKKEFSVNESHLDQLKSLLHLCIKSITRDKSLGKPLLHNVCSLLKLLTTFNPEDSLKVVSEILSKFFEGHNVQLKLEVLTELILSFGFSESLLLKVFKYVKQGRNPSVKLQSSEMMKTLMKGWKVAQGEYVGKLLRVGKKLEKLEIKLKVKNNIQRNLLCAILAVCKNCEGIYEGVQEEVKEFSQVLGNRPSLSGILLQIRKAIGAS